MPDYFTDILADPKAQSRIPARSRRAREWFRKKATQSPYENATARELFREGQPRARRRQRITRPQYGQMFLMQYSAKHHKTLPYWDKFPLIFPFSKAKRGFLGVNFHYLPLRMRAHLMDSLYDLLSDDNFDQRTKLRLTYQTLQNVSKIPYYKPTIKHYLASNIGAILQIHVTEWDTALWLPVQRFQKATETVVYRDSRRIIKS